MPQARDEDGNIWEVDAQGNAIALVRAANAGGPQMPADPTFPYQGPKAQADVANTQANARVNTVQANVAEATAPAVIAKTEAEAEKAAAEAAKIERERAAGRPALSPEAYAVAMAQANGARGLDAIIKDLEDKYRAGPGSTSGLRGIKDYFHSPGNERFDNAANAARGTVAKALGFTGGQLNSAAEAKYNLGAYIPQSDNFDGTIEDAIERLKELQQAAFTSAVSTLGGVPDANGRITPIPEGVPLNAMTIPRIINGERLQAAEFGAATGVKPLPPEIQQAHAQLVQRLIAQGGGRIDPQAYVQGRAELLANVPGFQDNDPAANAAWAERLNNYFEQGGKTVPGDIGAEEKPLDARERMMTMLNTPPVAAGVGFADMMGMGGVTALAPDQMGALAESQPEGLALGNIAGAIGGTSMVGKAAGWGLKSAITPRMAAYGRMKLGRDGVTMGREVGTDALYSGIYGGVTGENPLEAAAWGTAGSLGGRAVGKTISGAVGGVTASAPVQALRARGVPLTVGQSLGGFAKGVEDRATSIPLVGDIINARRLEGLQAFNREAFDEAGRPIGARVRSYGQEGLAELLGPDGSGGGATGRAYDAATAGVRAPLDDQFMADIARARAAGQQLPPDLQVRYEQALRNRVDPVANQEVFFHGSPADIDGQFRPGETGRLGPGIYFTPKKEAALEYAKDKGAGGVHERLIRGPLAPADDFNSLYEALPYGERPSPFSPEGKAYVGGVHQQLRDRGFVGIRGDDAYGNPSVNVLDPDALDLPGLTGDQYQQAVRGLKSYRAEATKPGFEQDYREALGGPINALRGVMERGGGEGVVQGLGRADTAYRSAKTLQDAVGRAKGGSQSGEMFTFTPAQLQGAISKNQNKFPGAHPLSGLANDGQAVLPSRVPDSGTAGRIANMAAGGGLLTGGTTLGGVYGGVTGDGDLGSDAAGGAAAGGLSTIALMSALALGGKKGPQKAMVKALLDRPQALKTAGAHINTKRGLFGRGMLPFVLSPAYTD